MEMTKITQHALTPSLPQPVYCPGWKVHTDTPGGGGGGGEREQLNMFQSYNKSSVSSVHLDGIPLIY